MSWIAIILHYYCSSAKYLPQIGNDQCSLLLKKEKKSLLVELYFLFWSFPNDSVYLYSKEHVLKTTHMVTRTLKSIWSYWHTKFCVWGKNLYIQPLNSAEEYQLAEQHCVGKLSNSVFQMSISACDSWNYFSAQQQQVRDMGMWLQLMSQAKRR